MTALEFDAPPVDAARPRPLLGLVLGSGAARGFAHIGILRVLIANGIVPDTVIGTSMGALVGGCYATNQLDPLESWARSLTMRRIISYLDVRFGGSGLISGGRLANRLHESIGAALIEELPPSVRPRGIGRRRPSRCGSGSLSYCQVPPRALETLRNARGVSCSG